jgi:hypothetical protein
MFDLGETLVEVHGGIRRASLVNGITGQTIQFVGKMENAS